MSTGKPSAGLRESIGTRFPWLSQFIRFGIVGASNTLISYLTYALLVWSLSLVTQAEIQAANFVSFVVSVANAYFWNTRWVFRKEAAGQESARRRSSMVKFFVSYGGTYLLSVVLLFLWTSVLDVNRYVAPVLTLAVTVPTNFVINKFWTFRSAPQEKG